jgi:hypothetical protein
MTNKAITLTLDKAARRVVSNGLNREWDILAKLMSDISVKITNEKNPDEHASLTARYTLYLNQQLKVEEVQAILDNV